MTALNLSLLREKVIVLDADGDEDHADRQAIAQAMSNRVSLSLSTGAKEYDEKFIIRAHTMHLCARMAAVIMEEFQDRGFLANRLTDRQWDGLWKSACGPFDVAHNPHRWAAVYHDGQPVFATGAPGPLLDIIEGQQAKAGSGYDQVIFLIQDAFEQVGKNVSIDYDSNIGLVCSLKPEKGRCSVILRGAGRTTTFNFQILPTGDRKKINMAQCLVGSAAFLEGVQLAYTVGRALGRMDLGQISRVGEEARMVQDARKRLTELGREIGTMERLMAVRYRPERPEFQKLVADVQKQTKRAGKD